MEFREYKRKSTAELREYVKGEKLPKEVSISEADRKNGSPREGDMIARNPKDYSDQWLVAKKYFEENFENDKASKSIPILKVGIFELSFAWYDMWIGYFFDTKKRMHYLCILPMLLISWKS